MDQNLNEPVGYVVPLHFSPKRKGWISKRLGSSAAGI